MIPLMPPPSLGGVATVLSTDNQVNVANQSVYTFTSNIGPAATNRFVVVFASYGDITYITGATINGAAMTQIAGSTGTQIGTRVFGATVPAGTSATIVITGPANVNRCFLSVFSIYGLRSTTPIQTYHHFATVSVSSSASLQAPYGGIILAAMHHYSGSGAISWAGVTEVYDVVGEAAALFSSGMAQAPKVGASSYMVTATGPASAQNYFTVLSFR